MAKNEQMLRLLFIEEFLRKRKDRGATYPEITDYLETQFAEKGLELKFTERTFQRDKLAIADVFGIQISYSRKKNAYSCFGENKIRISCTGFELCFF